MSATNVALAGNGTLTLANAGVVNVGTLNLAVITLAAPIATTPSAGGPRQVSGIVNLTNGTLRATTIQPGANTGLADVTRTFRLNWAAGTINPLVGASTAAAVNGVPIVLSAGTHTFNTTNVGNTISRDTGAIISGPSGITKAAPDCSPWRRPAPTPARRR